MDGGCLFFFFFQFFEKKYLTYIIMHMCFSRRVVFAMFVYPHASLSNTTTHLGQVTCDYYFFATLLHSFKNLKPKLWSMVKEPKLVKNLALRSNKSKY
jgi:hypothetical protein